MNPGAHRAMASISTLTIDYPLISRGVLGQNLRSLIRGTIVYDDPFSSGITIAQSRFQASAA